ncbi:MAG: transglycosylase SLT domain-containing protein [Pyrinomonadaceae bacterium]
MKKFLTLFVISLVVNSSTPCQSPTSDAALRDAIASDKAASSPDGNVPLLSAAEHLKRADAYSANRMFPQARAHWRRVLDNYPGDPGVSRALFGTARSYMWERQYEKAIPYFQRVVKEFPATKDGREGLAFLGATFVRLGRNKEAAETYQKYTEQYPDGERIESAHLNLIDALREAGKYSDADQWVNKTRLRFARKPAETNAVHARLRMLIYRQHWKDAAAAADELITMNRFAGSMTTADEARYLKALALENSGKKNEAAGIFASLAANPASYYGSLAAARGAAGSIVRSVPAVERSYSDHPIVFREELIKQGRLRGIDPRFLLAIMKQESSFKPGARSPAGARGLLQLVYDTAIKYNTAAGYPVFDADDLYTPAVNIAIGSVYVAELKKEFGGLYEAIAASYNGGEDNVLRWLSRSRPKDAGVFVSEIGFAETKNYVFKVMNNYRAYRDLYNEDLMRR